MIKILVLSDSHGEVFNYINNKNTNKNVLFDVIIVGGASSQGLIHPTSKSNSLNIFKQKLQNIVTNEYKLVIIMLGEVDCGFVIWYYKEKYNEQLDDQINRSIDGLFEFIKIYVLTYFLPEQIIILGTTLPTIRDKQRFFTWDKKGGNNLYIR
jgi:Icc-related predicted phosphoesterase